MPVVQCTECDFIWSSKTLPEEDLIAYYRNSFGSQRHLKGQIVNARINAWAITKLLNIKEVKNILDVGTGYGFLLDQLCESFGLDVTGVELSRQEATYANVTLGLNVINSSLGESGVKNAS